MSRSPVCTYRSHAMVSICSYVHIKAAYRVRLSVEPALASAHLNSSHWRSQSGILAWVEALTNAGRYACTFTYHKARDQLGQARGRPISHSLISKAPYSPECRPPTVSLEERNNNLRQALTVSM